MQGQDVGTLSQLDFISFSHWLLLCLPPPSRPLVFISPWEKIDTHV